MKIIGLTGGIAAGKSTVSAILVEEHLPIFDYDEQIKHLYDSGCSDGEDIYLSFLKAYPEVIKDARLQKGLVAARYFKDLPFREFVNETFGQVMDVRVAKQISRRWSKNPPPCIVLDVPLLFELGWDRLCDEIVVVRCPIQVRMARALKRRNMTEEKFRTIVANQRSEYPREDYTIDTNVPMLDLVSSVRAIFSQYH